ncbi:MAG: RNA methyltransferase [Candidatus Eremiobacteraeota bacterium]|nr:RNA methyltransferase [Candidatus Eremiobacteraeota bacterium]
MRITLAQAIPKGQKMDVIVEKATELGVARVWPLRSSRAIAEASAHKVARWRKIAESAAAQSGRTVVPAVDETLDFAALCERMQTFDATLFAWELDATPLRTALEATRSAASLLLVIGPEGGFSHDEAAAAVAAGAQPVSLGRRILRTETAALVALAALLYDRGEL